MTAAASRTRRKTARSVGGGPLPVVHQTIMHTYQIRTSLGHRRRYPLTEDLSELPTALNAISYFWRHIPYSDPRITLCALCTYDTNPDVEEFFIRSATYASIPEALDPQLFSVGVK